ncbi:MAG: hypothetical protein A2X51_15040 [Candidatus Rokubacteria bacterium GWC2_70_24]|nr:MAG: hypothetical protein A2X53_14805 [Candidatus Rokubacteria bacterium GWA2_70_23]OGK88630.1 MAG: hypothetical protein A2X51_15040 [Candidatus Rokubacteria bacterium GWC2_70_24]OGK93170.1 MAG: hypothetical protein A2X50_15585 [Candidatus Rokubacteria bacterium GWF2_70_14]
MEDMSDAATDCFPLTELYARLRGREDVMLIPHIGGRYADIVGFHDPALERLVEIYSDWGRFEMENPEKGIVGRTDSSVRWVSNTTGDDDGVDLTLAAPPEAVLRFRTPAIDLDIPLADLAAGATRVFPAGGVDLRVFARRLPARHTTRELRFEHVDPAPPRGACHAYWIRATQEDGAQAWTSPVYLEAAQAGTGPGDPLRGRSTAP